MTDTRSSTDLKAPQKPEDKSNQDQQELLDIMDASPIAISWSDMHGNIKYTNRVFRELFGYTVEDIPTVDAWLERAYPSAEYRDEVVTLGGLFIKTKMEGKETSPIELTITCKDGSICHALQTLVVTSNRFLAIYFDITDRKKIEEALEKSEEQYRLLADNMTENVWLMDLNTKKTVYVSPSVEKMHGYTMDEFKDMSLRKILTEESFEKMVNAFVTELPKAMATAPPAIHKFSLELQCRHKVGHLMWIYSTLSFIRDDNGNPSLILGESIDITERRLAQEALAKSEELYRLLADHTKDQVWMMDMNLKITYVSPSVEKLTGYTADEIKKLPIDKLLAPDSVARAFDFINNRMPKAFKLASRDFQYKTLELEFLTRDGQSVWGECSFNFIRNEKGEPVSILGEARNITDKKIAEALLRKSEEKYRTILEDIQEGYFETDLAGNFTFFNDTVCRVMGYTRDELFRMSNKVYTEKEELKKVFSAFNEVYRTGQPFKDLQWQIKGKDGTKKYIEGFISLIKDAAGNPAGFRGITRDITEKKAAETKLQKTLESLRKAVGTTIQVLITLLEARDPYTAGHQSRAADLARAIASEMGLNDDTIEGIRMAATIHDIGKVSVPAELLSKPTKLTNLEFSIIKGHSQSGYDMLKNVESPWPLADIVLQHHERMDGTGYPQKLKGEDIILEARILAVADVVEAIGSHRPYRPSLGIEAALEEIEKNKGTLYDEAVVEACLRLFREKGYQLK